MPNKYVILNAAEWEGAETESLQRLCDDAEEALDLLQIELRRRVAHNHPEEYAEALRRARESVEQLSMSLVEPVEQSKAELADSWALLAIGAQFGDGRGLDA